MKKCLNKIIEVMLNISIVIASIALIFVAIYSFQIHVLEYSYSNFAGYSIFEVVTGSMAGSVEIGDVVLVKITKDIQEDDIIVFQEAQNFITHRVISIEGDTITTKGDANNTEDKPIERTAVVGKVEKILPQLATWKKVFSTPSVYIPIMITILLLGVAFSYTTEVEEDVKEEKKEKETKVEETKECSTEKD